MATRHSWAAMQSQTSRGVREVWLCIIWEATMLHQDRLRILLALYDRRLVDVAAAAGMPKSTTSEIINCRRHATREQVTRLEAAIIGSDRGSVAR